MSDKDYLYDLLVHDLVGPLAVVATTVSNLLAKTDRYGVLSESQRQCLERVQRNTLKAQGLVQDILEVARSEEALFRSSPFAVRDLIREAIVESVESFAPTLREEMSNSLSEVELKKILGAHGISWDISGKYASVAFAHDRRKVLQIVRNLVSNALKYRARYMDVSVTGESDLIVAVSNDGPGIPERDREALYKRFVRIQNSNVNDAPGLGLGLFCIKALVEGMHGEISLGSRERFNTCFRVRIPFLEPGNEKEDGV